MTQSKFKKNSLWLLIVLLLVGFIWLAWLAGTTAHNRPDFTSFSSGEYGISLLFDTLGAMGYPVRQLYQPTASVSVSDVVIVTEPRHELVQGEEMLNWLRGGGRMFFFDNRRINVLSDALEQLPYIRRGGLNIYRVGSGYVITAPADSVANVHLMNNPEHGANIAGVLNYLRPQTIWFAESYHGFMASDSAFGQMPLWIRLAAVQIMLIAAAAVWHKGKRFGAPIPLYEIHEREEHEQVYTLARLYRWADRKKGRDICTK